MQLPTAYCELPTVSYQITNAFAVTLGLHTTVVLNRDGTICRRRVGLTRKPVFEQMINASM